MTEGQNEAIMMQDIMKKLDQLLEKMEHDRAEIEQIKMNVILITYNQEQYIRTTLQSILDQKTNFRFNILVADDHSEDETLQIIREMEKQTDIPFVYPEHGGILFHRVADGFHVCFRELCVSVRGGNDGGTGRHIGLGGLLLIQFWPGAFELAGKALPLIYGPNTGMALMLSVYLVSLPTVVLWLGRIVKISLPRFPDLSYGVYLYGWPIQQSIVYYVCVVKGRGLTPPLLLLLSIAVALPAAALSWYAVEKHVLKTKNWYWYAAEKVKQLFNKWRIFSK